jgi:hypothetical protein
MTFNDFENGNGQQHYIDSLFTIITLNKNWQIFNTSRTTMLIIMLMRNILKQKYQK